jgi:dipeptidyl aminopeptidase/acylaminoacyl peptidase
MRRITFLLLFLSLPLAGQTRSEDDAFFQALQSIHRFEEVAISPDAKKVAWTIAKEGAFIDGHLLPGGKETAGLAWSPDSKTLAHLIETKGQRQLYVGERKMTDLHGWLAEPKWSPDGKSIALLFIEKAKRAAGPLVAMSRAVGLIGEQFDEQRVAVVDVATKKLRIVTPADMYVYHFDWSPDSTKLAAVAAPGNGDQNWWIAQLHIVDVAKAEMKSVYKPKLQIANPKWTVDGLRIALIEGLMSDEGSTGGDVMLVPADGGEARNVTPGMKASATSILDARREGVTFTSIENGLETITQATTGGLNPLWKGRQHIGDLTVASDGATFAFISSSFNSPPEIWTGALGTWKQRTHANDHYHASWGEAKSIEWTNGETKLQGWLLYPGGYSPSKQYSMITQIHGGPASAVVDRFPNDNTAMLAHRGFFVFMPNPRGSYGGGAAFTQANVKDFGYGDLSDILTGTDAAAKEAGVASDRIGVWGWSYGGYMTMFTVTQTQRFKAAVAGAGIANWQSYYGENDITQWMIPYFGASVYDDPAVYAKSAPITFIKNVKTPTLVVVGERDGECPAPQSFEFWRALKTLGVETQLVVYADEGHRFMQPAHKVDLARRVVSWFEKHLK